MHSWPDTSSGSTQSRPCIRSEEEIKEYIRKELETVFDIGMKIRDRNIFYVLLMRDKKTGQLGFSIMLGNKTVLDLYTKGKYVE